MKDNPVAKHAHKFNKSAVHKDKKKAMKKGDRKHKGSYESVEEVLKVSDGAAAWIKDFQASDAPQFKGKSADKRKEMALAAYLDAKKGSKEETNEDLRKWFGKGKKGDWVRVGTDGEIKGQCAREPGEGKPKCMPRDKAHSMSKKDRGASARRKRRADPDVDRPGTGNKPIMVKTDKKESVEEAMQIKPHDFEVKYKGKTYTATGKKGTVKGQDASEYRYKSGGLDKRVWRVDKTGVLIPESIEEKNEPTNPKLWAKFVAQAKSKFDVYPSAYANGWAAKQYKAAGGGWKTVKESRTTSDLIEMVKRGRERRDPKVIPAPKSDMAKRMARGQRNDPVNKIRAKEGVNELSVNTLNNYRAKASRPNPKDSAAKQDKRYAGVARAARKLDKKLS